MTQATAPPKLLEMLMEILKRVRRIETRLTKFGIQQGYDLTDGKERCTLTHVDPPVVDIANGDVSFQDVLAFVGKRGIVGIVIVTFQGHLIGNVTPVVKKEPVIHEIKS
jgi:hypothetical protein